MASKLPLPDICTHGHDWSPIAAAPSQSLIAGVIAGFLFAGIVVVLSQRTRRHQDSTRALKLMLTAFLGLVVTSYLYATLAGEETCPRAETEAVLNGGVLGICGIVLIVSLTWLVAAYHTDVKILDFLRGLAYFASLFVVLLLCVSSTGYIDAELPHGSHLVNNILIYVAAGVAIGAAMALIRRRAQPPEEAAGDDATMQDPAADRRDAAVHRWRCLDTRIRGGLIGSRRRGGGSQRAFMVSAAGLDRLLGILDRPGRPACRAARGDMRPGAH